MDQASIKDILIRNMGYSSETLYEIDCFQRMIDHFMVADRDHDQDGSEIKDSGCLDDNADDLIRNSHSPTPMTMVANLINNYLAEVASDVNLKLEKFQYLASTVPDFARSMDGGMYQAINIYLKDKDFLIPEVQSQIAKPCDLNFIGTSMANRLRSGTTTLPVDGLPKTFRVLFFEQLRLHTSAVDCLYVFENYNSQTHLSSSMMQPEIRNMHLFPFVWIAFPGEEYEGKK
uniref:NPH3 domain-containing protein n=1 Tax=Lactuca sativa TaxID=4236 RepID=A0A9R1US88_LACSA|nr:hypothetical protein LSAT_V11C800428390 [Lactuca sativa]